MDRADIIAGASFRAVLRSTLIFILVMVIGTDLVIRNLDDALMEEARQRVIELSENVHHIHQLDTEHADLITRIETLIKGAAGDTLIYAVYDSQGQFLTGNAKVMLAPDEWDTRTIPNENDPQARYLLHARKIGDLIFVSGRDLGFIRTAKFTILRGVALEGFMIVIAMIGIGYWMSMRSQKKFEHMESVLQRIAEGDSSARISTMNTDDQIDRIARKMNFQLDKLERLVDGARRASAAVAHDLRKPLARVSLQMEQALAKAEAGEDTRAEIEDALAGLDNLSSIISTILRITRIENHDLGNLQPFDLRCTLDEIFNSYEAVVDEAGQTLTYHRPSEPMRVTGDADMLAQLVINLLQNSITHAGAGAKITIETAKEGNTVILTLTDTGPGIPEAIRERVFEPLFRADVSRTKEGNGLGLALVKAIVDRHGATFAFSDANPGLRATLVLPAA